MWIETLDGFVNSDHVVEISSDHSGEKSILHLVGGKTAVSRADIYDIAQGPSSVVPALPGFEVLYLNNPGMDPIFFRDPVIAWCISTVDDTMFAVTTDGSTRRPAPGVAILYPDGRIYAPARQETFPNGNAWIDAERKSEADVAALKAVRRA
jgi:hypothetical protein